MLPVPMPPKPPDRLLTRMFWLVLRQRVPCSGYSVYALLDGGNASFIIQPIDVRTRCTAQQAEHCTALHSIVPPKHKEATQSAWSYRAAVLLKACHVLGRRMHAMHAGCAAAPKAFPTTKPQTPSDAGSTFRVR